ncbi:hypothetical protein BpHYR1_015082 [Brachionus plicatilis]|uniref:Uncharacterized protein n=1 Tax=Brachionus plicatilis TaxID=10195 RepID=A0A3M7QB60_BRAPC|nr:hypothetical protein BpHYR1_015082 [Brachionus plicatilis]
MSRSLNFVIYGCWSNLFDLIFELLDTKISIAFSLFLFMSICWLLLPMRAHCPFTKSEFIGRLGIALITNGQKTAIKITIFKYPKFIKYRNWNLKKTIKLSD